MTTPGWELSFEAKTTAYIMFWEREKRRLYWWGILPWNWSSNDIWTAYLMADRQIQCIRNARAKADFAP